jgi:S-adenosylmethionine:tRNA ribosyltransferase-isomerase
MMSSRITFGTALSEFDFALPPERIAQHPARPRDAARLLVVGETLADRMIRDLPALLRPGDLLVANDTRVIPAQLEGRRGAARIGITLDAPRADGAWHALARNARRLRAGDVLNFGGDLSAVVVARDEDGGVALRFDREGAAFEDALVRAGALALPPYIARPAGPTEQDAADYQTVFASRPGAVAAPTAGLHFTPALLAALDAAGTIGADAARAITAARRVIAVGTTSLRLIESAAEPDGSVAPFAGETDLFILPGYRFRRVDLLLTNFHLPRSTLFMLVCAFAGTARMRAAYAHAIASGYRFYSYGDACLLERA